MENRASLIERLESQAQTIRRDILTMIYKAQSGHPGGSLSATDIVTALYFHVLRVDPGNPKWLERDRFIMSKGHACPSWYACLAERGFFPKEELLTLREINGRLQGHPDMKKTPGIDFTTGSLGQGLSGGVGMALGLKRKKPSTHVYVLLSDGELNEGQVWEAAMAAAKFKLDNLTAIIDYNDLQLDGYCHEVMPFEPLREKWLAFNWQVFEMDGHDMGNILDTIEKAKRIKDKPSVIIAHTVKGKGVSFMEDKCDWHGKSPNDEQFVQAMKELGADNPQTLQKELRKPSRPSKSSFLSDISRESLSATNKKVADQNLIPTRDAFGEALVELGAEMPNLVVLEADISKSTRTNRFAKRFPARFYQFGIAEANMMVAAAGMSTTGKIPFYSTYAVFGSMRACEQLRTFVAYPHLNVKVAVSHGGITPANDGVTHQATEDLGMMRTIPGLVVIMPGDYYATKALVRAAAKYKGPVYLRFTRDAIPIIYGSEDSFEIGKGKLLREGNDISIIAIGDMLCQALKAAELLGEEGISAEVIDMHTLKPIDQDIILTTAQKTGYVLTVEDHQIECGLGGAVAEVLIENLPTPMRRIGLRNTFAESGRYDLLLEKYGMSANHIFITAKQLLDASDS
ncbi:MAG TPA: transketolase [Anaerolineae bacterium]|nr:transketolase [Anaerolineae bacterium]